MFIDTINFHWIHFLFSGWENYLLKTREFIFFLFDKSIIIVIMTDCIVKFQWHSCKKISVVVHLSLSLLCVLSLFFSWCAASYIKVYYEPFAHTHTQSKHIRCDHVPLIKCQIPIIKVYFVHFVWNGVWRIYNAPTDTRFQI